MRWRGNLCQRILFYVDVHQLFPYLSVSLLNTRPKCTS